MNGEAGPELGYVRGRVQDRAKELVDTLGQLKESLRRQAEMES